jgi:hypothetical protein
VIVGFWTAIVVVDAGTTVALNPRVGGGKMQQQQTTRVSNLAREGKLEAKIRILVRPFL